MKVTVSGNINKYYVQTLCMVFFPGSTFGEDEVESDGNPALELRVTYDAPCHLLHAQRIADPPLAVLRAIPDLTLIPLTDAEQCCGAAGIYNLLEPATSNAVLAPKLRHIASTGADWVATGNPGCLMQIGAGLAQSGSDAHSVHPVDLLDASYGKKFG